MASAASSEQRAVAQRYARLREEVDGLYARLGQVDQDRSEHDLVLKQLRSLDGGRRCWHQVGAVLAERTVADVLPVLADTRNKLQSTVERLTATVEEREKEMTTVQKELVAKSAVGAPGAAAK